MNWTRAIVEQRLVEAVRVRHGATRSPVPSRSSSAPGSPMPVPTPEDRVRWERERWEWLKALGYVSEDGATVLRATPWPAGWADEGRLAVTRAEEAEAWAPRYVRDLRERLALQSYVVFRAFRRHGFAVSCAAAFRRAHLAPVGKARAHQLKDAGLLRIVGGLNAYEASRLMRKAS